MSVRSSMAVVRVPVTNVWQAPDRPRPVDRSIVAPEPDLTAWLAALDSHPDDGESGNGRLGLHGRIETQLVAGEPVRVTETTPDGHWAQVQCPWQPAPLSADGYPGWVPAAHVRALGDDGEVPPYPRGALPTTGGADEAAGRDHPTVRLAREHLGTAYLWGGLTPYGFDCSGLVHWAWRTLGTRVPRDAYAQQSALAPIDVDEARSGDLYFFAHPGRRIHHVGIVVQPGRMVHASETGKVLVEEDLPGERRESLVAAARVAATG